MKKSELVRESERGRSGNRGSSPVSISPALKIAPLRFQSTDTYEDESTYSTQNSHEINNLFQQNNHNEQAVQILPTGLFGRRMSWTGHATSDVALPLYAIVLEDQSIAEKFKILLTPPQFDRDDLLCSVHTFMLSLVDYIPSVKRDETYALFRAIKALLNGAEVIRLYGLLVHYCYWNIIHPAARQAMIGVREQFKDKRMFNDEALEGIPPRRFELPAALTQTPLGLRSAMKKKAKTIKQIEELFQDRLNDTASGETPIGSPVSIMSRDDIRGPLLSATKTVTVTYSPTDTVENNVYDDHSHDSNAGEETQFTLSSEASLSAAEKEQLFVQLEVCVSGIFHEIGKNRHALVVARQALISSCHFVVDEILTMQYPWFASTPLYLGLKATATTEKPNLVKSIKALNLRLRRLAHQSLSDLIDPSR